MSNNRPRATRDGRRRRTVRAGEGGPGTAPAGPYAQTAADLTGADLSRMGGAVTPLTDRLTNNIAGTALTALLIPWYAAHLAAPVCTLERLELHLLPSGLARRAGQAGLLWTTAISLSRLTKYSVP